MKVLEIMHKGAASVAPETPVIALARTMRDMDIGALPVVEGGQILGIVTDRDVAIRAVAGGRDLSALVARDVMSGDVVCCRAEEEAHGTLQTMEARKVRRMPVIDDDNRLVGMVSLGDIVHAHRPDLTEEVMKAVSAHHVEAEPERSGSIGSNAQSGAPTERLPGGTKEPIRIRRAVGRAVSRVRGDHPRRGREDGLLLTILCDLGLILAAVSALAALVLIVIGLAQVSGARVLIGLGLGVLSVVMLIIWERVFWEPFTEKLSQIAS